MFNFFRRKKNTEPTIDATASNEHVPELSMPQNEQAPVEHTTSFTEPLATQTPSTPSEVTAAPEVAPQNSPDETITINHELLAALTQSIDVGLNTSIAEPTPVATTDTTDENNQSNWLSRLKNGLSKTGTGIKHVFVSHRVDEALFESLEDALLLADVGIHATTQVMSTLRQQVSKQRIDQAPAVKQCLKQILADLLTPLEKELNIHSDQPIVMMVAGVNGAGKTTSIGKLTHHLQQLNKTIVLAAGDTFRAAAREQLAVWGVRNGVTVIAQESGDPAAVVFDAISSAQAKRTHIVIADTAGRLPTQLHLMDELKKIKRVADKAMSGAPHEILLVLDGSMGQNALMQVKAFDDAVGLTGLIITKLDGSAKGGILAALAVERPMPIYFIGIGEAVQDLQTFDAQEFVDALLD